MRALRAAAEEYIRQQIGDEWLFGEYSGPPDWKLVKEPEWNESDEMLFAKAKELGWVQPRLSWNKKMEGMTPEEVAEMVADRLRGGPKMRMMEFAVKELGSTYEELIERATNFLDDGDYWTEGGRFEGQCIYDGFWQDYMLVTGRAVPAGQGVNFFSCSC
jgi:hypothetical protein